MAYLGNPLGGIRGRFIYTATAGQTTFSGTDDHNRTLSYTDAEFTDVFLNGVKLDKSDYTATSGTSIVLDSGATAGDTLEVLGFDTFSVFSGDFSQDVTIGGSATVSGNLTVDTNTLHVDSSNNAIGILTTAPSNASLDIGGRLRVLQDAAATTGAVIIRESSGGVGGHLQFVTNDNSGQRGFIASNSSGDILFGSSAERLRMLSAGGLTFNGDTAAANALDDYEQGTWTPTFGGSTSDPTVSYSIQLGRYTKIGDMVFFAFRLLASAFSGGDGNLRVRGLPFSATNVSSMDYAMGVGFSNNFSVAPQVLSVFAGTNLIGFHHNESTTSYSDLRLATAVSTATSTAELICSGSFKTE